MTLLEFLEKYNLAFESICHLIIIIGVFYTLPRFKYKLGAEERKLYLDNANKVRNVLGFVYQNARIDDVNIAKLRIALNEAALYLSKDIFVFIEEIYNLLIRLSEIQTILSDLEHGNERTKLCNEKKTILVRLGKFANESVAIYRKHIVDEPMAKFKEVTQCFKNHCKRKTKADCERQF